VMMGADAPKGEQIRGPAQSGIPRSRTRPGRADVLRALADGCLPRLGRLLLEAIQVDGSAGFAGHR
jgi:hypothetical protein